MSDLKNKKDILEKANYRYHFLRSIYFNIDDKKIFSLEAIEDHDTNWLLAKINKEKETDEWELFFNTTPSEKKYKRNFIGVFLMNPRTIDDRLREEYFFLLPEVRKAKEQLEAEVRFNLVPILRSLNAHERFEVQSRIKECESAINALRRRQEASLFEDDQPEKYSLEQLRDLAGVRILVFPSGLLRRVDKKIRKNFHSWTADHVPGYSEGDDIQAFKYFGFLSSEDRITCEIQIVPMLTGLFWKVEHEAIYKPKPELKNISRSLEMRERTQEVLNSLKAFEKTFEKLCKA